jgi:hypothetical protein
MPLHQTDADVERLVWRSAAFRAARAALTALDAAASSSAVARGFASRIRVDSLGLLLVAASVTLAAIVTLLPAAAAPAGRYPFAAGGALAGALLMVARRGSGSSGSGSRAA